ncbi:solanesyl diphosphate synthase 1, chloroplastic-like [Andrographis paniculata]|uniref:solanesyl diphosphate synthase 1, chloroplastic-like n=1 Tax=Andrographis paniculata TaxID=175694 RepID=UPI0021E82830|nr:solanesyl diphosphate synthase 1, chloroplastic-like [Andrographis paniculata]
MYVTCHHLVCGRAALNFVAHGCNRKSSFNQFFRTKCADRVNRNRNGSRGYEAGRLVHCRQDFGRCGVFDTKNTGESVNEVGDGPLPVMDLRQESTRLDMFELVAEDLLTLNKNLQSIISGENPVLMSAAEQIFGAGGKRMRPALVFLVSRATAEIFGLKDLTKEHRRLAEIIEMIHTASLVHDDVLDESDTRRGKETINQLYGTRVAVLVGDFLFAQSSWHLSNLENLEVIKLVSQVIKDFAKGEIKQASSLFDCDIRLDEYLIKSHYKTASLIAASTKGAAMFSGASREVVDQMYMYGKNLGLSFQIVDDILDFTQSAKQLGKPSGSDLAKGYLTAPVIFALEKEPCLKDMIQSEFIEPDSLRKAIEIIKDSGSIERAWELARAKADEALENLWCLPESSFRSALEHMVSYNLKRIA